MKSKKQKSLLKNGTSLPTIVLTKSTELKQQDEALSSEPKCEYKDVLIPPDGGWGWAVVFASFMCNTIADGMIYSFGTFLESISKEFNESKARVSLVGSLMSGIYLIVGPFASALANRYGFRTVAITGGIISSISIGLCYFATSVNYLCFFFGILGGIGFGLVYVPAVIAVGFYFERWRGLATGIGVCGSGIGTFIFAPLTSIWINNYGWRLAFVFQAAFALSCCIFGAFFRPVKPTKVRITSNPEEVNAEPEIEIVEDDAEPEIMTHISRNSLNKSALALNDKYSSKEVHYIINNTSIDAHNINEKNKQEDSNDKEVEEELNDGVEDNLLTDNNQNALSQHTVEAQNSDLSQVMYRDDMFYSGALTKLPQYTSQKSLAFHVSVSNLQDLMETSPPAAAATVETTESGTQIQRKPSVIKKRCATVRRILGKMLDFSLLKSPSFIVLSIGGFFTMIGFYVPFMYLADRARLNNIDENTSVWMIASIGVANTVGRVLFGSLSALPSMSGLLLTNIALTVGGIATIASGASMSLGYQFTYTIIFGLAISCFASVRSIIIVDLMGLDRLTNAFGLLLMFQGTAAVIGSPAAGAFKEATGSYDYSFYMAGSMILISAVLCYPLNYINKREKLRNKELQKSSQNAV